MRALRVVVILVLALALAACATASISTHSPGPSNISGSVPEDIRNYYANTYLDRPKHKAFALALGDFPEDQGFASGIGNHGRNPQEAMDAAIYWCNGSRRENEVDDECLIYAINDTVVWGMSDEEFQAVVDSY